MHQSGLIMQRIVPMSRQTQQVFLRIKSRITPQGRLIDLENPKLVYIQRRTFLLDLSQCSQLKCLSLYNCIH
jgi:hypothetical protein